MPAGNIGLLISRWLWRNWLTLHRQQGLMSASVLVVGDYEHLLDLIPALDSVPDAGYRVVAACCSNADESSIGQVPVLGDESEAADIAQGIGVNTVACTSSSRFDAGGLRRLSWALEGQNVEVVVVPRLTEVAGQRVLTRPVAGLSLLHVEAPAFAGPQLAVKAAHRSMRSGRPADPAVPAVRSRCRLDQARPQRPGLLPAGTGRQRWHVVSDAQVSDHAGRS